MEEEQNQTNNKKNTKTWVVIAVIVVLAVAAFFTLKSSNNNSSAGDTSQNTSQEETTETKPTQVIENFEKGKDVALYEIKGENGKLDPKEFVVKIGEPVAFVLRAVDADYSVKFSYSDDLPVLEAKKGSTSDSLIFAPEKTGEFPFSCLSCSGTEEETKGILIVK